MILCYRTQHRRTLVSLSLTLTAALAGPVAGQSMSLKTVPIATGEQYLVFPSKALAMGSLWVAYDDPIGSAFGNPARGAGLDGVWLLASPTTYHATGADVAGNTLPLAVTVGGQRWFGTASVALQQLETPNFGGWWWLPASTRSMLEDDAGANTYISGSVGTRLGGGRTAIGVSGYSADLEAVDGVGQLYANAANISQQGSITDWRAGVLQELGQERRLEGMVGRSGVDMTHDVLYVTWLPFDPTNPNANRQVVRVENNRDRTVTWSGSLRYTAPAGDPGVRFGLVLVGNTKSHPKIPNYDLVNIPRDPGNSAVFGLGAGVVSKQGGTTTGAELMLQPGRSHTWAFADSAITTPKGVLQPGDRTVDNRFRYTNWTMALGLDHQWRTAGMQVGLRVNRYGYALEQENYLAGTSADTRESWVEWSPSWGFNLKLGRAELLYTGRWVAKGFDIPLFASEGRDVINIPEPAPGGNDFVVAPTQPVNLPDFRVTTHRLTVAVPLSARR